MNNASLFLEHMEINDWYVWNFRHITCCRCGWKTPVMGELTDGKVECMMCGNASSIMRERTNSHDFERVTDQSDWIHHNEVLISNNEDSYAHHLIRKLELWRNWLTIVQSL